MPPPRKVAYRPLVPSRVRAEVQRLDAAHEAVGYGPHDHSFYEVVLFDRPGGVHVVAGTASPVVAGQAWLLPPRTVHDLAGLGDAEGWLLIADPEALGVPALPRELPPRPGHVLLAGFRHQDAAGRPVPILLGKAGLRRWTGWLAGVQAEHAAARLGYDHVVRSLLHQLLVDAARRSPTPPPVGSQALVAAAFALVDEGFRSRLSLSDVAAALAVSPGYLTASVRRQTGRPLGEWILQRRLAEARTLLAESDQPVGSVAHAVGFGDVSQFTRQFRRHHGRAPGAWRAAVRSRPATAS